MECDPKRPLELLADMLWWLPRGRLALFIRDVVDVVDLGEITNSFGTEDDPKRKE
ncbi:MAG: hypothetical protein FJY85_03050 [Deltaproteobacteria bacterium]|nr:hypothetical protein [Deltaproteobacteria bacterium]